MKIKANFSKNFFLAEYFKEDFTHEEERELPNDLTGAEAMLAHLILSGRCEKSVLAKLVQRGYIDSKLLRQRINTIDSEINKLEEDIIKKQGTINPVLALLK